MILSAVVPVREVIGVSVKHEQLKLRRYRLQNDAAAFKLTSSAASGSSQRDLLMFPSPSRPSENSLHPGFRLKKTHKRHPEPGQTR